MSLSSFGVTVRLALWNGFDIIPSLSVFWKSLKGIRLSLKVLGNSASTPLGSGFLLFFVGTPYRFSLIASHGSA